MERLFHRSTCWWSMADGDDGHHVANMVEEEAETNKKKGRWLKFFHEIQDIFLYVIHAYIDYIYFSSCMTSLEHGDAGVMLMYNVPEWDAARWPLTSSGWHERETLSAWHMQTWQKYALYHEPWSSTPCRLWIMHQRCCCRDDNLGHLDRGVLMLYRLKAPQETLPETHRTSGNFPFVKRHWNLYTR